MITLIGDRLGCGIPKNKLRTLLLYSGIDLVFYPSHFDLRKASVTRVEDTIAFVRKHR